MAQAAQYRRHSLDTGATDADAVFGMIYTQAEDDFHRIEVNATKRKRRLLARR